MYVETHQKKIPAQAKDLEEIRKKIREKGIRNIRLNWV
jgi:hypothetical protein